MANYVIGEKTKIINQETYVPLVCNEDKKITLNGLDIEVKKGQVCAYVQQSLLDKVRVEDVLFFPGIKNKDEVPIISGDGENVIDLENCNFIGNSKISLRKGCGLNIENSWIGGKVDIFSEIGDMLNIKNSEILGNITLKNSSVKNYKIMGNDISIQNSSLCGVFVQAIIQGNSIDFLCDNGEFFNVNAIGDNISLRGDNKLENVSLLSGSYVRDCDIFGLGHQAIKLSKGTTISESTLVGEGMFDDCSVKKCNITFGDENSKQKSVYGGSVFYNTNGEIPNSTQDSIFENCENITAQKVENCEIYGVKNQTFDVLKGKYISGTTVEERDKRKTKELTRGE